MNKIHVANHSLFLLHVLFRLDQIHLFNLTAKIMKMCDQIFKKDNAPIQVKFFEL